ncbi:MAG: sulfatase-like hydrolase/transferase, partial [Planctomycetes bacterium]|nr:sulfatase-like hydrolase/transferase [Planctomycetota bacterium]
NGWIQRPDHRGYAPRSKRSPYDGGVRTPIIVSWPGRLRPGRDPALVSSLDLAPTVLEACGATTMASLPGHDLVAVAAGREPPREEVCGEIFTHDVVDLDEPAASLLYRWVVRGEWKLIVPQRPEDAVELYQVATDPMEQHDLAREQPARVELLRRRLDRWWPGGVRQPPR